MNKPTPPQAILLRELSHDKAFVYADFDRHNQCVRASGYHILSAPDALHRNLNPATFGALFKCGWVETDGFRYHISQTGRETLAMLGGSDFICARPRFTAGEIAGILRARHPSSDWVFFRELRLGSGYGGQAEQRIDAWAMHCWPSKKFLKIAYEIKIYRSDFLKEIQDPEKRKPALAVSNQFYFVAPFSVIKKYEVPEECGLLEVSTSGDLKAVKNAPFRETGEPAWGFVASIGRRLQED